MWFGTRAYMQEVPDADVDPDFSPVGWGEETGYLNGGLGVADSAVSHREYYLSWTAIKASEGRSITDYADGIYGRGLVFWLDPIAARANALPQSWATPSLAGEDAIPLAGDQRPSIMVNPDMALGYPYQLATYTITDTSTLRSVFIPVPPGHVGWVGVHGESDAQDFVKVTPFAGLVAAGPAVHPTILSTATTTRVNTAVSGGSVTGLEVSLDNSSLGAGESAAFTLAGLIVQVLPEGVTPELGGFISGQGHSGCRFMGKPTRLAYNAGSADRVSITAKLGEVGEWE